MLKQLTHFFRQGVWENDSNANGGWITRPFKIIIYTVRGIGQHDIFLRSAALTFYTVLSIVPIAALIFGFMKGFGFDEALWQWVESKFQGDATEFIDQYMRGFVDNMLARTRGGVVAGVGIVVLFWSVVRVFTTVENSFNNIWEVKQSRSLARQLSDYLSVVIVAPLLLISATALSTVVRANLEPWVWSWLLNVVFSIAELVLVWLLFAFIYWVMPNTRVKFKGALIAAVIAGTAFWFFQQMYFTIQGSISANNAVYGTFAAIPLLLVWVQVSWVIALVGAEMSFAYQNIDRYEMERQAVLVNITNRRKIVVASMVVIVEHLLDGRGPVTSEQIATQLDLPVRSVHEVVYELVQANLVVAVRSEHDQKLNAYMPARDVHELTVFDVVDGVESGNAAHLDVSGLPELHKVSALLDRVREATKHEGMQTRLSELI